MFKEIVILWVVLVRNHRYRVSQSITSCYRTAILTDHIKCVKKTKKRLRPRSLSPRDFLGGVNLTTISGTGFPNDLYVIRGIKNEMNNIGKYNIKTWDTQRDIQATDLFLR